MAGHEEEGWVSSGPAVRDTEEDESAATSQDSPGEHSPEPRPLDTALGDRVQVLEEELRSCQRELHRIKKQLSLSQKLHRAAETSNQELQRQVEELSQEIHERNKVETIDQEVQTDDYSAWSDYYSYYYQNYNLTDACEGGVSNGSAPAEITAEPGTDAQEPLEDSNSQCEKEEQNVAAPSLEGEGTSLAESLRATAEAALSQTGFTYDENSGMYYDHSTGFYYDSESQLYYDPSMGIYYYCDVESGRYQFHSRVDLQALAATAQPTKQKRGKKKREQNGGQEDGNVQNLTENMASLRIAPYGYTSSYKEEMRTSSSFGAAHGIEREEFTSGNKKPRLSRHCVDFSNRDSSSSVDDSEPEEGELTDSEKTSSDDDNADSADNASAPNSDIEDTERIWPPCIRVIVVRSPVLQKGSLFIITAVKSATIGREKDLGHTIRIPELSVSKFHAEVYFDHDLQSYVLVDQGSQNGTVINGNQILQPKAISEPLVLNHGDEVKFGETVLSFHVHPGSETCFGCEPGQVRAHLSLNKKEESSAGVVHSKEEKEQIRRQGLKQIRVKYGLQSAGYEDNKVLKNSKYKDRAGRRRQVVGSEGTFQKEDAPASVHVEINDSNKGRKMLEKMGWKKGEGLGKSGEGMRDPIQLQLRKKQAGLGGHSTTSIEAIQCQTQNKKNWEKARERYAENFQDPKKPDSNKASIWVKSTVTQ